MAAHNSVKLSLLHVHTSIRNLDILCLSETYFDSPFSSNGSNLIIPGYDLFRAYHPMLNMEGFLFIIKIVFHQI